MFAFPRRRGRQCAAVIVPRLIATLSGQADRPPLGQSTWNDTFVRLHGTDAPLEWRNVFTGQAFAAEMRDGTAVLRIADVLSDFPVALLVGR